jgi:hypothetical protein
MIDRTAVVVRSFPVGKHTVTMTLTRRRFLLGGSIAAVARLLLLMPTAP